jgi:hypothetical protein
MRAASVLSGGHGLTRTGLASPQPSRSQRGWLTCLPNGRWAVAKAHIASLQWALDMALANRLIPDEPDLDPDDLLRRSILATELRSHYRRPEQ